MCVPGLPLNIENIKGGVHSATINLLRGFIELHIEMRVLVFTREVKKQLTYKFSKNIDIVYFNEGIFPYHSLNYLTYAPFILKKQIKEFNPSVIHYQEGNSFMLTRLLGVWKRPIIQTIHGMSLEEAKRKGKVKDKIIWYFNGLIQKLMTPKNIIHLSEFSKNRIKNIHLNNEIIIPNAIREEYFKIKEKKKTTNKLLYIGIIDNNKNLSLLLETLDALKKENYIYKLDVIGGFSNDTYRKKIQNFINERGIENQISFHGWLSQYNTRELLSEIDILVVCSKHESLPMVIAEAMAAGKPIIASSVGGIPEMIEENVNGYLYKLTEQNRLVELLKRLFDNSNDINKMGQMGKGLAMLKYDCKKVANKTFDFYNKVIENK